MKIIDEFGNILDLKKYEKGNNIFIDENGGLWKGTKEASEKHIKAIRKLSIPEIKTKPLVTAQELDSTMYKTVFSINKIEEAKTLRECYHEDCDIDEGIYLFSDLLRKLKILHENLVIGDIHSDNILIDKNLDGHFLGIENAKLDEELFRKIYSPYYINNLKYLNQTKYSDIIKIYIEALSYLLNADDFVQFIKLYGYNKFVAAICNANMDISPNLCLLFLNAFNKKSMETYGNSIYNLCNFITPDNILKLRLEINK